VLISDNYASKVIQEASLKKIAPLLPQIGIFRNFYDLIFFPWLAESIGVLLVKIDRMVKKLFGVTRAVETAVPAAKCYVENMQQSQLFLKMDSENAFNTLRGDSILEAVSMQIIS
jgi:hypothetical protein